MFFGIKGKVGNNFNIKLVGFSIFIRLVSIVQQMKFVFIVVRFFFGFNIFKGFRFFKLFKIVFKVKFYIFIVFDVVLKIIVNKFESVKEIQLYSNEGFRDEEKNVNENFCNKENDKMDDSVDLSNLFLNDMFEEEMVIFQKLISEFVVNSGKVMKKISEEYRIFILEKVEEIIEKSLNGGFSVKMFVEMVDVLQYKFDGFQIVFGKVVFIDEESLKKVKELWDNQIIEIGRAHV